MTPTEAEISSTPLSYKPYHRTRSSYLGFVLLPYALSSGGNKGAAACASAGEGEASETSLPSGVWLVAAWLIL